MEFIDQLTLTLSIKESIFNAKVGEKNSHTPPTYSQPDHKLKLFWVTTLREATKKNGKIKEKVLLFVDFNDIANAKMKENIMPGAIPKRWRN